MPAKTTRLNKLHICGPGLSVCCSVISVWGIIMLAIVGGLMLAKSAAFIEDIPMGHSENNTTSSFFEEMDEGFKAAASNCFGAVGLYAVCLIFCLVQVFFNVKVANMNADK